MILIFMSLILNLIFPLFVATELPLLLSNNLLLQNFPISKYLFFKNPEKRVTNKSDTNYVFYV